MFQVDGRKVMCVRIDGRKMVGWQTLKVMLAMVTERENGCLERELLDKECCIRMREHFRVETDGGHGTYVCFRGRES